MRHADGLPQTLQRRRRRRRGIFFHIQCYFQNQCPSTFTCRVIINFCIENIFYVEHILCRTHSTILSQCRVTMLRTFQKLCPARDMASTCAWARSGVFRLLRIYWPCTSWLQRGPGQGFSLDQGFSLHVSNVGFTLRVMASTWAWARSGFSTQVL